VHSCDSCARPAAKGKVTCMCHGKGETKAKNKKPCPCQRYTKDEESEGNYDPLKNGCDCCICAGGKGVKGKKCQCAESTCLAGRRKKRRCDCATDPLDSELYFDYELLETLIKENRKLEQKDDLKIKSDMTQTTSGFRFKLKKKPPSEISLEDAIKYFEDHPEEVPEPLPDPEICVCIDEIKAQSEKKRSKKFSLFKRNKCGCPEDEARGNADGNLIGIPPGLLDEEAATVKGFKLSVGAKGSGSKGLSGVCCFDLLNE
jgi:hypothetical protein